VFYELIILGQHYSYASCVTQLTIYNRGNMRLLADTDGVPVNVPDVYEVDMTLTDMVMPSKNLFQTIKNQNVVSELARNITTTTVEGQQTP
jgi:tRNA A-37 threonylcarbamoyl transferase component Bud32